MSNPVPIDSPKHKKSRPRKWLAVLYVALLIFLIVMLARASAVLAALHGLCKIITQSTKEILDIPRRYQDAH